jgi:Fe-S oxidoreductase
MRVSLFVTCLGDTLHPQTGRAVVRLLERLGCSVEFPVRADLLRTDAHELRLRA